MLLSWVVDILMEIRDSLWGGGQQECEWTQRDPERIFVDPFWSQPPVFICFLQPSELQSTPPRGSNSFLPVGGSVPPSCAVYRFYAAAKAGQTPLAWRETIYTAGYCRSNGG